MPHPRLHRLLALAKLAGTLLLASCGSDGTKVLNLMPAPAAYTDTGLPFAQKVFEEKLGESDLEPVFFATDRAHADSDSLPSRPYSSHRGGALRLGRASVIPASEDLTWGDAWKVSLLKTDAEAFPIKVGEVEEFGVLSSSITPFSPLESSERQQAAAAAKRYAREINRHLARTGSDDIHIYVHGYKNVFENPILTTAELWHFLGHQDVFIAYSWPATPRTLAYISDSETAHTSARNLRTFIRFLSKHTNARRINLIGYSAGSRVLTRALADLALEEKGKRSLKLGTAIILAGDVDRGILAGYLSDGTLDILEQLVVYQSDADWALLIPRLLTGANRAGESMHPEELTPQVRNYLYDHPKLALVDVSEIDSARKGNGHGYLRGSPWVSSDLLISLSNHLSPDQRGLVRMPDSPVWHFPPNYPERLRGVLLRINPEFGR